MIAMRLTNFNASKAFAIRKKMYLCPASRAPSAQATPLPHRYGEQQRKRNKIITKTKKQLWQGQSKKLRFYMEKTHAVSKPGCKKSVAYHPKSGLKWMQSTKPLCQQQISDAMMKQEVAARFDMRKLGENERVESFDCGDADLNDFILNDALPYRKEKLAITYAYVDRHDNSKVVAFFCLSNDRISLTDFDDKSRYNRFSMRFVNKKRLKSYPAVKIGRLAVSESMKEMSIGKHPAYLHQALFLYRQQDRLPVHYG